MTVADGPTLGEVMRRLDDVARRIDTLSQHLAEANTKAERTFIRVDVYEARQAADAVQMQGLEQEVHSISKRMEEAETQRRTMRALVFSALVAPVLVGLILAVVLA